MVLGNISQPHIQCLNTVSKLITNWYHICHYSGMYGKLPVTDSRNPVQTLLCTFHPDDNAISSPWQTECNYQELSHHHQTRWMATWIWALSGDNVRGSDVTWFALPWTIMPGASRTAHCKSVVLWKMLHTFLMVGLFILGPQEVFRSWTLLFVCFTPYLACLAHTQLMDI